MKKIFIVLMLFMGLIFSSCSKCSNAIPVVGDNGQNNSEIVIENTISTNKEDMYLTYGENYRWYETCILMNNFLDEDTDGSISQVVNVFQGIVNKGKGYDTEVTKYQYFSNGTSYKETVKGFWIEDFPLEDSLVKISYKEAYELIQQVNLPKPHTRNAILRNPIGPKKVNPQWVFGNIKEQLWVDAVTGKIKQSNPAFEGYFGLPLGEWP